MPVLKAMLSSSELGRPLLLVKSWPFEAAIATRDASS